MNKWTPNFPTISIIIILALHSAIGVTQDDLDSPPSEKRNLVYKALGNKFFKKNSKTKRSGDEEPCFRSDRTRRI